MAKKKKSKYDEKVKLDMTFEEAIDKMFENRKLPMDANLEKVFKYNGLTSLETEDEEIKQKLKLVFEKVKQTDGLVDLIFSRKNPSYDLIKNSPRNFTYEVSYDNMGEGTENKVAAIYAEVFGIVSS